MDSTRRRACILILHMIRGACAVCAVIAVVVFLLGGL
jgi:hypothetical protein